MTSNSKQIKSTRVGVTRTVLLVTLYNSLSLASHIMTASSAKRQLQERRRQACAKYYERYLPLKIVYLEPTYVCLTRNKIKLRKKAQIRMKRLIYFTYLFLFLLISRPRFQSSRQISGQRDKVFGPTNAMRIEP